MQFASQSVALTNAELVFTSRDLSRIAQISLRQVQWWDETQADLTAARRIDVVGEGRYNRRIMVESLFRNLPPRRPT